MGLEKSCSLFQKPLDFFKKTVIINIEIKMAKINYKEVCVVTRCPFCGRANEVEVNEMDYLDWDDGKLAQDAFPYLSASEREMLISGICPTCWDTMF